MSARRCDVLIVGGGPAGLIAARELCARAPGLEVLLLERDRAIGSPVRCGEGVGSGGLSEFMDPAGASWISRRITRVIFWAPDGTEVRVAEGDVGFVLDRARFEPAIAAEAGRLGAEIVVGTEVTGLARTAEGWEARTCGPSGDGSVRARLVIGADGVEGMVGRWAGLDTRVPARDMESCAQYLVAGIDFDPDAIYLHFGSAIAPGGYAWVFPKGVGVANVGLGIVALRAEPGRSARQYLDRYLATYFPTGVRTGYTVGGVIVHPTVKRTVADGLLLCGDAAHMINPLSGGGIVNAMKAGRLAAATAADALAAGDTSAARLQRYHHEWMALLGDDHIRFHRLKDALAGFDDAFFDRLARTTNEIPAERRTLRRIFASALVRHPTLMPVVLKYFV
ncbi:MAG TPA: NAD(P)/FAD-dependent oxidoreductase [Gemmatimonadaceae bacterium]|nr:NAD(P)/FAD-dependent oxidoreductase [Gemmatimonadaceae bacterium]